MKSRVKNIDWVDGIKAFAIIGVLYDHFVESYGTRSWLSNPGNGWPDFATRMATIFPTDGSIVVRMFVFLGWLLDMGVGVFFILSGVTLTISALNKPLKPLEFYRKRLLRIYPLYLTIHLIFLAAKYGIQHDPFTPGRDLLSLLGLRFKDSLFFYMNPSWWFIWAILQFYLLFPFLMILLKKAGVRTFLIVTFAFTILSRLSGIMGYTFYSKSMFHWMTGIFIGTRLFEFAIGMFVGYLLYHNNQYFLSLLRNLRKTFLFSIIIWSLGFVFSWTYTGSLLSNMFISVGFTGFFYCLYQKFFTKNKTVNQCTLWLGRNSFSVFLIHQPFMIYAGEHLLGAKRIIAMIVAIIGSFVGGHYLEKFSGMAITWLKSRRKTAGPIQPGKEINTV